MKTTKQNKRVAALRAAKTNTTPATIQLPSEFNRLASECFVEAKPTLSGAIDQAVVACERYGVDPDSHMIDLLRGGTRMLHDAKGSGEPMRVFIQEPAPDVAPAIAEAVAFCQRPGLNCDAFVAGMVTEAMNNAKSAPDLMESFRQDFPSA